MSDADREAPIWRSTILWVGFLIVLVVAVLTVLIPELQSDDELDQEQDSSEPSE